MRICRQVSWTTRVVTLNFVALATASSFSMGQSFDYPDDSPSLISRVTESVQSAPQGPTQPQYRQPQIHQPQFQQPQIQQPQLQQPQFGQPQFGQPQPHAKPKLFSKLLGRDNKAQPVFGSPRSQSNQQLPPNLGQANLGTQHSVYLSPYPVNRQGRVAGYEPDLEPSSVRPVTFQQQQSILERGSEPQSQFQTPAPVQAQTQFKAPPQLQRPTRSQSRSQFQAESHFQAPSNFQPSFKASQFSLPPELTGELPKTKPAGTPQEFAATPPSVIQQPTQQLKASNPAVTSPTARIASSSLFAKEFDKAYRFIDPDNSKKQIPRVAQSTSSGTAPRALEDFAPPANTPTVQGDFAPVDRLQMDVPDFIQPQLSEQSPNADLPGFNPPSQVKPLDLQSANTAPREFDKLPAPAGQNSFNGNSFNGNNYNGNSFNANNFPENVESPSARSVTPEFADLTETESSSSTGDYNDLLPPVSDDLPEENLAKVRDWEPPTISKNRMSPGSGLKEFDALNEPSKMDTTTTTTPMISTPIMAVTATEPPLWWKSLVSLPLNPENQSVPVDSNGLVFAALKNSPRIQAVSKSPLIRELQVVEANAEFDPVRFVQSQFQDRVDPVGNSLTIGGGSTAQFLNENIWTGEAGVRRKLRTGADVTVSQQLGFQNSNSLNFTPQDQGTATLALNVAQPLLRGRGRYYNQAQILIAQSTGGVAWEVFQQDLQEELEGVVTAYWDLYLQRSIYLQRQRNVQRGEVILNRLTGRRELDSLPAQIARAKSSVQTRRTQLANAFRNVRDAETEIRRRTAGRNWMATQNIELLPGELPTIEDTGLEVSQVVETALNHRPEIRETMRRIKIAGVQRDISQNELLPELSFLVGTYVSALRGESDVLGAFTDQFGEVTPGYSFGLEYELPRFNRAARSRFQQRNLQLQRLQNELEEVMQNVIAESQISVRRIESAIETLIAAEEAILAARADVEQNESRWESFALTEGDVADGVSPTTVLDQLLDSQDRLSQAELVFAQAEQELKVSEVALQRSMGTLLMHQQVSYDRTLNGDSPQIHIRKQ